MIYVGFEVFIAVVIKSIIFWDVTPRSVLSCSRRSGGTLRLHLQGRRNNLARTSKQAGGKQTLKMEAICSSETLVNTQRTTRHYIPEDCTLHNHRCENLKSYTVREHIFLYSLPKIHISDIIILNSQHLLRIRISKVHSTYFTFVKILS
jgi:hypothetical protein